MTRTEQEIEYALELLGERWKYNKQSPASHRTIERGASEALNDAMKDEIDTDILYEYLENEGEYERGSMMDLFEFGYTDAVLWYLERETLTEKMNDGHEPVLSDAVNFD